MPLPPSGVVGDSNSDNAGAALLSSFELPVAAAADADVASATALLLAVPVVAASTADKVREGGAEVDGDAPALLVAPPPPTVRTDIDQRGVGDDGDDGDGGVASAVDAILLACLLVFFS